MLYAQDHFKLPDFRNEKNFTHCVQIVLPVDGVPISRNKV